MTTGGGGLPQQEKIDESENCGHLICLSLSTTLLHLTAVAFALSICMVESFSDTYTYTFFSLVCFQQFPCACLLVLVISLLLFWGALLELVTFQGFENKYR